MRETLAIEDPDISTHAPRTGSDRLSSATRSIWANFNPRSPHGERLTVEPQNGQGYDFNPRSPHGERRNKAWQAVRAKGISTHAPRTGSDATYTGICQGSGISTHAPRTGSDFDLFFAHAVNGRFQPTLPARGATDINASAIVHERISTHAPRTGSDVLSDKSYQYTTAISTHAPRTGSDRYHFFRRLSNVISTPAPRTGSDEDETRHAATSGNFNPRSPHGERRGRGRAPRRPRGISTHAPRTGSDGGLFIFFTSLYKISTHAPRTGSD